jgi:hypothetical protein
MHAFFRMAPLLLAAAGALAQTPELPKDLHGRWTGTPQGGRAPTQPFDLEKIERKAGDTFAARLSWVTTDAKCTIRYQPVTGRVTDKGLVLDAVTPCGQALHAELVRGAADAWVGQATTAGTPPVVVDLTAK